MEVFSLFYRSDSAALPFLGLQDGLKFKIRSSPTLDGEVFTIRHSQNEVVVILTPSDGHAWYATWAIDATEAKFKQGEYTIPEKDISVGF